MRTITIIKFVLLLAIVIPCLSLRPLGNTLFVTDFGAIGDGTTDNTSALNAAFAASASQQKNLNFPAGTYLCNTIGGDGNILKYAVGGLNNLTIYGTGSVIIKTTNNAASTLLYIFATAKCSNMIFSNLRFLNTHTPMTGITDGMFFAGTGSQLIDTVYLLNSRFEGFSQDIAGQGVTGWWMTNDSLYAPHGHDDAQTNTQPAVDIWMFDNSNGFCQNVYITSCHGNGYTGSLPISGTTRRGKDGMVYGTGYNVNIQGCDTKNYSQENFVLQPVTTNPSSTLWNTISDNLIDCTILSGSTNDDGSKHRINYGIRCDCNNTNITGNTILTYSLGILHRGIDYGSQTFFNYNISYNKLRAATDTANYTIGTAILVQGNTTHPTTGVNVQGNICTRQDINPISILNTTGAKSNLNQYSIIDLF